MIWTHAATRLRGSATANVQSSSALVKSLLRRLWHLFDLQDTNHRRIVVGALWVSAFVILGRLGGAIREVVFARQYGANEVADAYQLAYSLAVLVPNALTAAMAAAMLPRIVRLDVLSPSRSAKFSAEVQGVALLCGAVTLVGILLLGGVGTTIFGAPLPDATRELATDILIKISPVPLLILVAGALAIQLQAREKHVNVLLEGVPPAVLALIVVAYSASSQHIEPLVWGTVAGVLLHVATLWLLGWRTGAASMAAALPAYDDAWRAVLPALVAVLLGQIAMVFVTPIDQYFAASDGTGGIAVIGYVNRIVALLFGVGAMAIARATLPVITRVSVGAKPADTRGLTTRWAMISFGLGTAVAALVTVEASPIIRVFFERGAFTSQDTQRVAGVLEVSIWQVPFYFCGLVYVQLHICQGRYRLMAWIGVLSCLIKIVANFALSPLFGLRGVAAGSVVMYLASCVAVSRLGRQR